MERLRCGSKEAFLELMERWEGRLFRFFLLLGACDDDAEDGVQETFLRIFAYRARYRPTAAFESFLFRIARNVLIDAARKRRRTAGWVSLSDRLVAGRGDADPSAAWDASIDVRAALDGLPEKLRVVVVLNVFEGLGYRDIAAVLSVPLGTVKSRMFLAMSRLRAALGVASAST